MDTLAARFYDQQKNTSQSKLTALSRKIRFFAWYRLFAFLLIFAPLFVLGFTLVPVALSLLFLMLFFYLVKENLSLLRYRRWWEMLQKIVEDERLALLHQFSHFDGGKEFQDISHQNAYDLDLFGEGSLFQFINRTCTEGGRQRLAGWLLDPPQAKKEIEQRQASVRELAGLPAWRLQFLVQGHLFRETSGMLSEVQSLSESRLEMKRPAAIRILLVVLPLLTLLALAVAMAGYSTLWFIIAVVFQWLILWNSSKMVDRFYQFFGRKSELLEKYMNLLTMIEEQQFKSPGLLDLQKQVRQPRRVSALFRRLKKFVKQLEYRQNLVVNIFLNSLFLWDLRCVYNLWNWHRQHRRMVTGWLYVIAETDALISLSTLAYNHPSLVFPTIHDGGFTLQAKQVGHPLLAPEKRVCNDFSLNGWGKAIIITGANMAGKSTFLRTVGVNLILGRTGAPVCAEELIFTPVKVYTNMRTTDSLLKEESYFFAELKRIQLILQQLQTGERLLVILDEMLKGTNSVDKLNGSRALIRKLLELKAVAIIATHDLKLSEMEHEYPQLVVNKCFEITMENGGMSFDYLLSDGVTQTMNATFMMRTMGII